MSFWISATVVVKGVLLEGEMAFVDDLSTIPSIFKIMFMEGLTFASCQQVQQRAFEVNYDKTWIYDKIEHEIKQFCSSHLVQEVYIEKFEHVVCPLLLFRLSLLGKTIMM